MSDETGTPQSETVVPQSETVVPQSEAVIPQSEAVIPAKAGIHVNKLNSALIFQLFRFGLVGITAAAIHFCIVVTLVQNYAYEPLVANIFAFMISFQASYFGHRRFTFTGTTALHAIAFPKLLALQIFNLIANESLFYFFLSLHIPYQLALILVLSILPLFTFAVSKLWIFK